MENLREQIEQDLYDSIESEWKMPFEITYPNGTTQIYSKNNPTELLGGQMLYFSQDINPETGETIVVDKPVLSVRLSSLDYDIIPGEKYYIKVATSPRVGAAKQKFVFTADHSFAHGTDIGFKRLYLQKVEESVI